MIKTWQDTLIKFNAIVLKQILNLTFFIKVFCLDPILQKNE